MTGNSDYEATMAAQSADVQAMAAAVQAFAKGQGVPLDAAVKWGQPSLAPPKRCGTSVRIGEVAGKAVLFVHCGSPVIERFLDIAPTAKVEGKRAFFPDGPDDPAVPLFLNIAFGYRLVAGPR